MSRFFIGFYYLLLLISILSPETANCKDTKNCSDINVVVFGDSMTWISGEDFSNPTGWAYYFKKIIEPKSFTSYARSGATITNSVSTRKNPNAYSDVLEDDNVIYNQIIRFMEDYEKGAITEPDIFIIFAGGNDAWFERKRPGSFNSALDSIRMVNATDYPSQRTTLGESLVLSIRNLEKICPGSSVLLVTPTEMSKVSAERIHDISDKIHSVGESLGCFILRADQLVEIRHDVEKKKFTFTKDGVHTNSKGAAMLADVIVNYLTENLCKNK